MNKFILAIVFLLTITSSYGANVYYHYRGYTGTILAAGSKNKIVGDPNSPGSASNWVTMSYIGNDIWEATLPGSGWDNINFAFGTPNNGLISFDFYKDCIYNSSGPIRFTTNGFEVSMKDGYFEITNAPDGKEVTIPSYVTWSVNNKRYNVASIGDRAFYNHDIVTVDLPATIEIIESSAFSYCRKLKEVSFSSNLKKIGYSAFSKCTSLSQINFPESLTTISDFAFSGCSGLTEMNIPTNLTNIGKNVFDDCPIKKLEINTKTIQNNFSNFTSLETLIIGDKTQTIEDFTFYNCLNLLKIISKAPTAPTISSNTFRNYNATLLIPSPTQNISTYKKDFWQLFKNIEFENENIKIIRDASLTFVCDYSTQHATLIYDNSYTDYSIIDIPDQMSDGSVTFKVIGISPYTFSDLTNLNTVNLPTSFQEIHDKAFYNCTSLKSISLPASITSIQTYSFYNCSGLREIILPPNLTEIGDYAFYGCSSLTDIEIPTSVTYIGPRAFIECTRLTNVIFNAENCSSKDGYGIFPSNITSLNIGNNVKVLPGYIFFDCSRLSEISIPSSVTSIGKKAFYNCKGIKTLRIEDSESVLDFSNLSEYISTLSIETLYLGRRLRLSETEDTSSLLFRGNKTLNNLTIGKFITSIEDNAFEGCYNLSNLTIGNSVTHIGANAFQGCKRLTSIAIPNSVASIGDDAFYDCLALTKVEIADLESWCKIDFGNDCATPFCYAKYLYVNGKEIKEVVIPNTITSVGDYTFSGCSGLTSVTIGNSVTSIGVWAFHDCSGLTRVTIGNSVASIGLTAFYGCSGLTSIKIPNSVTSIGNWAFYGCSGLTSIEIPNSVTSIGNLSFSNCTGLKSVTIGNSVTSIGDYAFEGCSGLTSIEIPNSVTAIGDRTFSGCTGLTSVTIGNSVTSIGNYAFYNCSSLTSVEIPNSVTSIGKDAFYGCSRLRGVDISDVESWCKIDFGNIYANPLRYAHYLYVNGEKLIDLVIPNSITSIGDWTFAQCYSIKSVVIPNSVVSIGQEAFEWCDGLRNIFSFSETVPACGNNIFYGTNKSLCDLWVPEGSITEYAEAKEWKDFRSINPIIFPTSIILNSNELNLLVNNTYQLEASILPIDTTVPIINWSSSDSSIVTVSNTGEIIAKSAGSASIIASCSNVSVECVVNVISLDSSSLVINSISMEGLRDKRNLKTTESLNLTANLEPINFEFLPVEWKATPDDILDFIVPEGGNGKEAQIVIKDKVNAKNVTVTAFLKDAPEISASYTFDVEDLFLGDANDNGKVTVSDVVTISDYIVHKDVKDFCFINADVVKDMQISPADVTATVNIIMDETPVMRQISPVRTIEEINDYLIIDNFNSSLAPEQKIGVKLENTLPYVAIYASFKIPEGMEVKEVTLSERSRDHQINYNITDDVLEVILFSFTNQSFEANDANLFEILVSVKDNCDDIEVNSVTASDAYSNEYKLHVRGGHNSSQTYVINTDSDNYSNIFTFDSGIEIRNAANKEIRLYSLKGELLFMKTGESSIERIPLSSGIYIIIVDRNASKVIIK